MSIFLGAMPLLSKELHHWSVAVLGLVAFSCLLASAQSIDVTGYILPVDAANRGAEISAIHPAFDLDPQAADFGGQKIPAMWRSNGLVTGFMGIVRFGPAMAAYLCWTKDGQEFCPPFTPGTGEARMTRMQSDAVTVEYSPFPGVKVIQTTMAVNAHLLRSRLLVSGPAASGVKARLMGGRIDEDETGHLQGFDHHTDPPAAGTLYDGVPYTWQMSPASGEGRIVEFSLSFGPRVSAARAEFGALLPQPLTKNANPFLTHRKPRFHTRWT